jgi:hypothetical protein
MSIPHLERQGECQKISDYLVRQFSRSRYISGIFRQALKVPVFFAPAYPALIIM